MTDILQLLQAALPYVGLLFIYAALYRLSNATVALQFAAKTSAPEPSHESIAKVKRERDEARRLAEELRGKL